MRYILGFMKSIILVVLIVASIYQTGKLWFEDISDRNFFYDTITDSKTNVDSVSQSKGFIVPEQVGVYIGAPDVVYTTIAYGASSYSGVVNTSEALIKTVLSDGSYVGPLENPDDLWEDQHIILILPFGLSGSEIASGFGVSDANIKDIGQADTIIIAPASEDERSLHMYIESSMSDTIQHYQINKQSALIQNEALYSYLTKVVEADNNRAYTSTRMSNSPLFHRTLLLPEVSRDIQYHSSLYWEVPLVEDGQVDEPSVRQYVRGFFDNPDVMSKISYEDEVRFTAGNVIVRYTNEGQLDYTSNTGVTGSPELYEAIAIAQQFINSKADLSSFEYHLSGYAYGPDDLTIYYSYGYNGFPIVMDMASKDYYRQPYSISVKVRGNEVVHYRSLVREVPALLPQFESLDLSYGSALDDLLDEIGALSGPITDMYLGYKWSEASSEMKLHWVVEVDDDLYFVEVGGN